MTFRDFILGSFLLLCIAILAGCATKKRKEIRIPITVSCVEERPQPPELSKVDKDDGLFVRVQKLLSDREKEKKHRIKLEAVVSGCE